jgi:hypothetical protein
MVSQVLTLMRVDELARSSRAIVKDAAAVVGSQPDACGLTNAGGWWLGGGTRPTTPISHTHAHTRKHTHAHLLTHVSSF